MLVVTGTLYNGQGQADSAGKQIGGTTMNATANAPAFFAGEAGEHAHGAALSGLKTQSVKNSQDGQGGYNQLIFDDTPGQARAELADDHPTIQRLLKEFANNALEDELDYRELSARLEENDWQKIAGDLNAKEIREGIYQ